MSEQERKTGHSHSSDEFRHNIDAALLDLTTSSLVEKKEALLFTTNDDKMDCQSRGELMMDEKRWIFDEGVVRR